MDTPHAPSALLTEAVVLRRLNVGQYGGKKLREAGVLVPDYRIEGRRVRLYRAERVPELIAAALRALKPAAVIAS
ncbi:MAG: hypothetical protein INR62_04305 [Rhodospirillales bacterium]|nr:hypothetical protein [Acetobacter sp.]